MFRVLLDPTYVYVATIWAHFPHHHLKTLIIFSKKTPLSNIIIHISFRSERQKIAR